MTFLFWMVSQKRHKLATEDYPLPQECQCIARIGAARGNNLFSATLSTTGELAGDVIVALPLRFNRFFWIKNGSFVIVEQVDTKTKVWGDIVHVLLPDQIKYITSQGLWPTSFEKGGRMPDSTAPESDGDDSEGSDDLFVNNNRYVSDSE